MYTTVCHDEALAPYRLRVQNDGSEVKVAIIGLGAMGSPIARRLAEVEEIDLVLYDVDSRRVDSLAHLGRRVSSVREAVGTADCVLTILPADDHVRQVASEIAAAAHPGLIHADLSTIAPTTMELVAELLAPSGATSVGVSITRGTSAAESGTLGLFVSHDAPALAPVFSAIASDVRIVGGLAQAKALKIANNHVVACTNIAICESLVLAGRSRLPAQAVVSHMAKGRAGSWVLHNHIERHVVTDDLGPEHFSTINMAKDVRLYLEMAAERGIGSPMAGASAACYRGTIAAGYGQHYHPVVVRWLESAAGARADVHALDVEAHDLLDRLRDAIVAVHEAADLDALNVLDALEIEPSAAAGHLASGSADNPALACAAEWLAGDPDSLDIDAAVERLVRVVDVADVLRVPMFMHEAARATALALGLRR